MLKFLVAVLLTAICAVAGPILTLHNTGLASPLMPDPFWTVNGTAAFVTDDSGFPFDFSWSMNAVSSKWISPQPSYTPLGTRTDVPGIYIYATSFDLTGLDASSASIVFLWAVDNWLGIVRLNGHSIGYPFPAPNLFDFHPTPVTIDGGFRPGINVLEFETANTPGNVGNPSGLRVEFTAAAEPTPEPSSVALVAVSLLVLTAIARCRRFRVCKVAVRPLAASPQSTPLPARDFKWATSDDPGCSV